MPKIRVESHHYPSSETHQTDTSTTLTEPFANYSNADVSKCDKLFRHWANAKGPLCDECFQINELFSGAAVDGSRVTFSDTLTIKPAIDEEIVQNKIWNKLIAFAADQRQNLLKRENSLEILTLSSDELCSLLIDKKFETFVFEIFQFLLRRCDCNREQIADYIYHIDFSSFTSSEKQWASSTKQVSNSLLFNSLNMSSILRCNVQNFMFDIYSAVYHWKLLHFHDEDEAPYESPLVYNLRRALSEFRRVFVVVKSDHELVIGISLHGNFTPDTEFILDSENVVYAFKNGEATHVKLEGYKLMFNKKSCDIYRFEKRSTFIWIGADAISSNPVISLNELRVKTTISVDLTRFSPKISKDSMRRKPITGSEIYVASNRDNLYSRCEVVNADHAAVVEKLDINQDYHSLDCNNPENEHDFELLSYSAFNTDFEKLKEQINCWAKYGVYEKSIEAYERRLTNKVSDENLQWLINFAGIDPHFNPPLMNYFINAQPLEIPPILMVSLIRSSLIASIKSNYTVVFYSAFKLLECDGFFDIMDIIKILEAVVLDYLFPHTALECMDQLISLLKSKKREGVRADVHAYSLKQINMLSIQTLEEFCSNRSSDTSESSVVHGRYKVRKPIDKKGYCLLKVTSNSSNSVELRSGDVIDMKRLKTSLTELMSIVRAVVQDNRGNIELSWVPRDVEMATWQVERVGNCVGFRHAMNAIGELCKRPDEDHSILNILCNSLPAARWNIDDHGHSQYVSTDPNLNKSQSVAFCHAENRLLALWQGPPGTGKTKTIFRLIHNQMENNYRLPMLVTA